MRSRPGWPLADVVDLVDFELREASSRGARVADAVDRRPATRTRRAALVAGGRATGSDHVFRLMAFLAAQQTDDPLRLVVMAP